MRAEEQHTVREKWKNWAEHKKRDRKARKTNKLWLCSILVSLREKFVNIIHICTVEWIECGIARYSNEMFYLNIILMFNFMYKLDWHPEYVNNWLYLILNMSVRIFLDINSWSHRKEKDWLSQCVYSYSGNSRLECIKGLTATDQGWNRRLLFWFHSQTKTSAFLVSFSDFSDYIILVFQVSIIHTVDPRNFYSLSSDELDHCNEWKIYLSDSIFMNNLD